MKGLVNFWHAKLKDFIYNYICFHVFQIDYFERAKRLEEIPLIKSAYEEQRIKDMDLWEQQEEERVSF